MFSSVHAQRAERSPLLREQGLAGSNPVIPTSVYKERPSRGRSFLWLSDPCLVRIVLNNLEFDGLENDGFGVPVQGFASGADPVRGLLLGRLLCLCTVNFR